MTSGTPLKQALLASRDVIISSQICVLKFHRFFTLGDGCWLPVHQGTLKGTDLPVFADSKTCQERKGTLFCRRAGRTFLSGVPSREDRWPGWLRNCLCAKCLCAFSGPCFGASRTSCCLPLEVANTALFCRMPNAHCSPKTKGVLSSFLGKI